MKPTKKIQFLIDVEVENAGKVSFKARAGEVVELSASSANRWLRRNKATIEIQAAKPKAAPKTVKANAKPKAAPKTINK